MCVKSGHHRFEKGSPIFRWNIKIWACDWLIKWRSHLKHGLHFHIPRQKEALLFPRLQEQAHLLLLLKRGKEAHSVFRVFYFSIVTREMIHLLGYRGIVIDSVVDLVLGAGAPLDWGAGKVAGELDCCVILPHSSPSPWRGLA